VPWVATRRPAHGRKFSGMVNDCAHYGGAIHDFSVGPKATAALQRDPGSAESEALRRRASLMGRGDALLSLLLVALAVTLVRGWPW